MRRNATEISGFCSTHIYRRSSFKLKSEISKATSCCPTAFRQIFFAITCSGTTLPFAICCTSKKAAESMATERRLCVFGKEMHAHGYELLLVSTRSDEDAQYFYRKTGYTQCGNLNLPEQTTELFFEKQLTDSI